MRTHPKFQLRSTNPPPSKIAVRRNAPFTGPAFDCLREHAGENGGGFDTIEQGFND
jgi:hypothetical protein